MTNTSSIVIHSQVALPKEYSNFLKEGNSVLVRILKQTAPNSYIAAFGGGRFPIKSNIPLRAGSRFMAKISFQNGNLVLSKVKESIQNDSFQSNQKIVQQFTTLSPEVSNLLMSLGLPSDNVSKVLLQTMIMAGVKINISKMNKARNIALKFKGNEAEASEAALILMDKGIEPTEENIQDVLTGFSIENNLASSEDLKSNFYDVTQIESELKEFWNSLQHVNQEKNNFDNVPNDKSFLDQNENSKKQVNEAKEKILFAEDFKNDSFVETPYGFLTIFNHMIAKNEDQKTRYVKDSNSAERKENKKLEGCSWVVVPFEFQFKKDEKNRNGTGVFRVFFDFEKKSLKKMIINYSIDGKNWSFVVSYKKEVIDEIKFTIVPLENQVKKVFLENSLAQLFDCVQVSYEKPENLFGFANCSTEIPLVEGIC